MVRAIHALVAASTAAAQLFGDQNAEYSGLGKYVTIINHNNGYKGDNYGASAIGSNGDTTTWAIMPTKLNENRTKYDDQYTATMTVGPTTFLYSYTEPRTYTNVPFTFAESCSFSGTSTAICTSSMGGMAQPCDPGVAPGDGFPGGTWIVQATLNPSILGQRIDFKVYEVVTKTTTIKDTDPISTPLASGPFPTEWSAPRTSSYFLPSYDCQASSAARAAISTGSTTSPTTSKTTPFVATSSSQGSTILTTSTTGGQGKLKVPNILALFVAALSITIV